MLPTLFFSAGPKLRSRPCLAGAETILSTLEMWAGESARSPLQVADLARAIGAAERVRAIERRLCDEGRLNLHRVPEVIARIRARNGAPEPQ